MAVDGARSAASLAFGCWWSEAVGTRNPKLPIEPHAFAAILARRGHAAPKNEKPMRPRDRAAWALDLALSLSVKPYRGRSR